MLNFSQSHLLPMPAEEAHISQLLFASLAERADCHNFIKNLAEIIHPQYSFSWLTISVEGQRAGMFADFENPSQPTINANLPELPHSFTSILVSRLRDTLEAITIADCLEYFLDSDSAPAFQQKVVSTISCPLVLNNELLGVINLSFAKKPDQLENITTSINYLASTIAVCLWVVLVSESQPELEPGPLTPRKMATSHPIDVQLNAEVVFRSKVMREIIRQVDALTNLDVPVLLLGETGTGKNMIARYIHDHSLRVASSFVRVNCPSLSSGLFESEMFGHAKGSFTGATKNRIGRFELAHKGTLFLDEVAELTMDMQSKLLQVLDDSSFERVGESEPIMVNMRIVAATNVHISEAIKQGRLRGDLFHRISVFTIEIPPLRKRVEDIPLLAMALSSQSATRLGLPNLVYTPEILATLSRYYWPGNTRELSNFMTRMVITQHIHNGLSPSLLKDAIAQSESYFVVEDLCEPQDDKALAPGQNSLVTAEPAEILSLAEMERQYILKILEHTGGVVSGPKGAAHLLDVPRSTLINRMHKLNIPTKGLLPESSDDE